MGTRVPDIAAGRLSLEKLAENFCDLHPPLGDASAARESSRCLYCYDAPCIQACPTGIDIPEFIRGIASGNTKGAALKILSANIMGGTCSRVCPVETLCQDACVRNKPGDKHVEIGLLQRYATDSFFEAHVGAAHPFTRAPSTGKRVAVVGAGPAGLSCAHRLALKGHDVTVFDARPEAGGLNEYGLAAYKMVDGFAQKEIDFILGAGGIRLEHGRALGRDMTLDELRANFDAVFLGIGLGGTNRLGIEGENLPGVVDAVDYIAELRQSENLAALPVGRRVIVIGGGNTAIDIAVQSKRLGAESVTLAYRRGTENMGATPYEQELAKTNGVTVLTWTKPLSFTGSEDGVTSIELERQGERFTLECDVVFKAIGQTFVPAPLDGNREIPALENGRIAVDGSFRTSLPDVYAGGDCVKRGEDLTVTAVQHGKLAGDAIHAALAAETAAGLTTGASPETAAAQEVL